MPKIKTFDGYLVRPDSATEVVSPAYDSVSPEQRREFSASNPQNFINTMRLMEDYPEDETPSQEQLLSDNKKCLDRLIQSDRFAAFSQPSLFIYQLGTQDHIQTGVVCEVAVNEYERGLLKKHENTRSSKEDLLAEYQKVVGVTSSPICLTYAQNDDIDAVIGRLTNNPPDLDFLTEDGEVQKIWRISDGDNQQQLQKLFDQVQTTYLTDGHHRAASGLRYAERMRKQHGSKDEDKPYNRLLIALFPDNQLNLLPFHRCVKDLNNLSVEQLIAALQPGFTVEKLEGQKQFESTRHGEFGMYVGDCWYRLEVKEHLLDHNDPVNSLDVSILQEHILDPVLGIRDMRDDPRLGYIAGISGDEGIKQTYSEGWEVIFACYATSIKQLMDVADANALMPPKSTYFDPKPRSGIFVRMK